MRGVVVVAGAGATGRRSLVMVARRDPIPLAAFKPRGGLCSVGLLSPRVVAPAGIAARSHTQSHSLSRGTLVATSRHADTSCSRSPWRPFHNTTTSSFSTASVRAQQEATTRRMSPPTPALGSAVTEGQGGYVAVSWSPDEGEPCRYPSVWLRDNCPCPACFNASSTSRLLLMKDLDPDVKVTNAQVCMHTF